MNRKAAMKRRLRFFALACFIAVCILVVWWCERSKVQLEVVPPPQLTAGATAQLSFSSARAGDISVQSSDASVLSIEVQSVSDGSVACIVTAYQDGTAILFCGVGGRFAPSYAVSVVSPALPLTDGEFAASRNSKKFHRISCNWVNKIEKENLIYFLHIEDAAAAGYTPCARCMHP